MKKLVIVREASTKTSTPGIMYKEVDGKRTFMCYTLEDVVREGEKVYGHTAIPAGIYDLRITQSVRFKKLLPEVLSVPNFRGVRIHGGNTHHNTEGCPLVGLVRNSKDRISNCAPAVTMVMEAIKAGFSKLEVVDANS